MLRLRSRKIFTNASLTLRVVELIDIQRAEEPAGHYVFAQASPIAVVVDEADGRSAMDLSSNPLAMEILAAALPEFGDLPQAG